MKGPGPAGKLEDDSRAEEQPLGDAFEFSLHNSLDRVQLWAAADT